MDDATACIGPPESPKATSKLAFLWGLLVCCSSLNLTVLPHIHWYATAVLLGPLLLRMLGSREISTVMPALAAPALLVLAFLGASFNSDEPVMSVVHGSKIVVLLLVVYPLFVANPAFARSAFHGAVAAVCLNMLLVVLHTASILDWAWSRTHGRWDTVLANRTTLSLLGCFVIVYALSRSLGANRPKFCLWVLACFSAVLVFLGGSRTYMIALPLGILYGLIAAWWTAAGTPMFGRAVKLLAGASFAASLVWAGYLMSFSDERSVLAMRERALTLLDFSQADSVESYLESQDPARLHLMEVAWDKIRNDPLRGSGFHSTYLVGVVEAPIHNAYLQSWADLGLLGLLSYTWLTLGWTLRIGAVARTISRMQDPESRAMYATAVWGLCLFVLIGLRGPLIVEPSDWFFFLIPSALYSQLLREVPIDQNRSYHQRARDGWRGNDSLEGPVEHRWAPI